MFWHSLINILNGRYDKTDQRSLITLVYGKGEQGFKMPPSRSESPSLRGLSSLAKKQGCD